MHHYVYNCTAIKKLPFHGVGALGEAPPLPEAVEEPAVADDADPEPPRDVVLLPLEPPANLTAAQTRQRESAGAAETGVDDEREEITRWVMDLLMAPT